MQAWRPFLIGASVVAFLGGIAYLVLRSDAVPIPEPVALVLLGAGLFACAEARRHLLKKV